jgi:SAM-dependent methyltransferase
VGLDPEGRIAFKAGGARRLPFPDEHFDLAVQSAGRPAPREAARVLRPGGLLLLVTPCPRADRLGLRRRLLSAHLARADFVLTRDGEAGGGSFLIARLRDGRDGERGD